MIVQSKRRSVIDNIAEPTVTAPPFLTESFVTLSRYFFCSPILICVSQ